MEQEHMSERAAALRMNMTVAQIRAEVQPSCDLSLSALYRWQAALNVPVADMLREPDMRLSPARAASRQSAQGDAHGAVDPGAHAL